MSFGFSAGDILAVAKVAKDIYNSLKEIGGAKSEYQELMRELKTLETALGYLSRLKCPESKSAILDSIKYAALNCRIPLEDFLGKIKKYDNSLGAQSKKSAMTTTVDKLGWTFSHRAEITNLQSFLSSHTQSILMLLEVHHIEITNIASGKAAAEHLHVRERLDYIQSLVQNVKDNVRAQREMVERSTTLLSNLFQLVGGEIVASLKRMGDMVASVCVTTQQVYSVVLEIKGSIATVDTRWTFFQDPFIVEDALGLKFPVPSEYDYDMLDAIIKCRFRKGPASNEVANGHYSLTKSFVSGSEVMPGSQILPGTHLTMVAHLQTIYCYTTFNQLSDGKCPMPACKAPLGSGNWIMGVRFDFGSHECYQCHTELMVCGLETHLARKASCLQPKMLYEDGNLRSEDMQQISVYIKDKTLSRVKFFEERPTSASTSPRDRQLLRNATYFWPEYGGFKDYEDCRCHF